MIYSSFPPKADPAGQQIRGLVFGGKWLEFISQYQINVTTTLVMGWFKSQNPI